MIYSLKKMIPKVLKLSVKNTVRNIWQSITYRVICAKNKQNYQIRYIVFVCTGNICRSAFAEHALRSMIDDDQIKIESCGICVDREMCSPKEAVRAALLFNVDINSHTSKNISRCDLKRADLIVPMDYKHYIYLISKFPEFKNKIRLLREYLKFPKNLFININDPYGASDNYYKNCFSLIKDSLICLIRTTNL